MRCLWQDSNSKKKRDEHEQRRDEPVNNAQNLQKNKQATIVEQTAERKSKSASQGNVLAWTLIALFLFLIAGAVIAIPKNSEDSVETLPPTPDNTLLEPYKDYLVAYAIAGAPTIAEEINAENAIRNCDTVQAVEACSYITPLFIDEMILAYTDWIVAGMPTVDDITLVVTTPSNIRSGPSTDYSIIDTADVGETLIKIEKINEWYQVLFNGQIGYIFGELVVPS